MLKMDIYGLHVVICGDSVYTMTIEDGIRGP